MKLSSLNNVITAARLAINNTAKDAEVAKKLANLGFPAQRMQEGKNLLTLVQNMQRTKKSRYDERWQVSEAMEQQLQALRPLFVDHVAATRFAFRHQPGVLRTFNIKSVSTSKWAWVAQATTFYQLMEDKNYTEQMAAHGIAPEALSQARTAITSVMELRDDRMHKKAEAEEATESRNQASQQLRQWVRDFHTSARIALRDTPQKLEAYGIVVRSLQTKG